MFALQISFKDGVSKPETVFVRRPVAIVGSSSTAHIVLDDLAPLRFQLRISRELGRQFRVSPVPLDGRSQVPTYLEGVYRDESLLDLGPLSIKICAIDLDLQLKDTEPLDRAGVRVLRQACSTTTPQFPALVVKDDFPVTISFAPDQPLYVGKARNCGVRLESEDVSPRHARLGFESGSFWVEDLGSTHGTFVHNQQISGRVEVDPGAPITLGRSVTLIGATDEAGLEAALSNRPLQHTQREPQTEKYPILVSLSEVARPARIVIQPGVSLSIGRDPSSDMWLGAPHVSRRHCSVARSKAGAVSINDHSTNGTAYDSGILRRGDAFSPSGKPVVMDFGGGVTVALCYSEQDERKFVANEGAAQTFVAKDADLTAVQTNRQEPPPRLRTATFFHSGTRPAREAEPRGPASMFNIRQLYDDMNQRGRAVIVVGVAGLVAFFIIVVNLLLPVFR